MANCVLSRAQKIDTNILANEGVADTSSISFYAAYGFELHYAFNRNFTFGVIYSTAVPMLNQQSPLNVKIVSTGRTQKVAHKVGSCYYWGTGGSWQYHIAQGPEVYLWIEINGDIYLKSSTNIQELTVINTPTTTILL